MSDPSMQSILSRFMVACQQQYSLHSAQYKVIAHMAACRTQALGGQHVQCEVCGFEQHRYHSCRDRHCPKCQQNATEQ